jgi:hypothetical protein
MSENDNDKKKVQHTTTFKTYIQKMHTKKNTIIYLVTLTPLWI